jgi:hypothetical protein
MVGTESEGRQQELLRCTRRERASLPTQQSSSADLSAPSVLALVSETVATPLHQGGIRAATLPTRYRLVRGTDKTASVHSVVVQSQFAHWNVRPYGDAEP